MPHEQQYPLHQHERPNFMYVYYVTGFGVFPFDMLRHDLAWPGDADAACSMEWESMRKDGRAHKNRTVRLHSYRKPTVERWHSFGWAVSSDKLNKEKESDNVTAL